MKTKLPVLLCVGLAGAAFWPVLLLPAADEPTPRTAGRVLVLENEHILEGAIERRGDQYRVRRSIGETWLPADQGLRLCADMEEAYAYLRGRANLRDPDERLRLARWCQLQGLRAQALAEVTAAVELRPQHAESVRLLHHLQSSATTAAKPATSRPAAPQPSTDVPKAEVSAESLGFFVSHVQPILMNTCAHCHATGKGGSFKLARAYGSATANHRATQHNLAVVLGQVQHGSPPGSLLLTKAVSIHGGAEQAPLKGRQAPAYRALEEWVRMEAAGTEEKADGRTRKTESKEQQAEGKAPKADSDGEWAAASESAKANPTGTINPAVPTPEPAPPPVQTPPTEPLDAYDPILFNRQVNPFPPTGP